LEPETFVHRLKDTLKHMPQLGRKLRK
jgi:hypothetical protein